MSQPDYEFSDECNECGLTHPLNQACGASSPGLLELLKECESVLTILLVPPINRLRLLDVPNVDTLPKRIKAEIARQERKR